MSNWGATSQEWATFHLLLGLTADLLPVVSNPSAPISLHSAMKERGKTPSRYNKQRRVAGIPKWSQHLAQPQEVNDWMQEPDYGTCLQTRFIRALDVDIPDPFYAGEVHDFIVAHIGFPLPERFRSNSGKILLAFKMSGEFAKRVIKTPYGKIEFLATGQQFIAAGTHPSGVRYEWRDGLPDDFPVLIPEKFDNLWVDLSRRFGIDEPQRIKGVRKSEQTIQVFDPLLDQLDILGWGNQGQAFIECPFKEEHTVDSGDTETCYFPKGTRGYEQGHFKCMHAHCENRSDGEFEIALGLLTLEFEDLTVIDSKSGEVLEPERPKFRRMPKTGEVLSTIDNVLLAVERPDVSGLRIAYDKFRQIILVAWPDSSALWRPMEDNDYTLIQNILERKIGFKPIALELLRRSVESIAHKNAFDSAIDWLATLKWDGMPRIDRFMELYTGVEEGKYARAVSRYLWTALAGRILHPGIKADMAVILVGEQGLMKSSACAAIAPFPDWFCNISFNEKEDNLTRKMRGKVVGEFGELRGLHTKEQEAIKDWIARPFDELVPKFKEFSKTYFRRLVFFGTTNNREFLADDTGNRRWLPVDVSKIMITELMRDREQLWAEGRDIFLAEGVAYEEAERLAKKVHDKYMLIDGWEAAIVRWLDTPDEMDGKTPGERETITLDDVLRHALNIEVRSLKGSIESKRVSAILRKLKYENKKQWVNGRSVWVWKKRLSQPGDAFC